MEKTVALFDLDYTLIDADSEEQWSRFLLRQGLVQDSFLRQIEAFYQDYNHRKLDFLAYEEFFLSCFTAFSMERLLELRQDYMQTIASFIRPWMIERVEWHRFQAHELVLITAANHFTTQAIVERIGIQNIISTQAEIVDGKFTGKVTGIPSYQAGKVVRAKEWLETNGLTLAGSWAYSDSINDLPLLSLVDHPVAVVPDPKLKQYALRHQWQIIETPTK